MPVVTEAQLNADIRSGKFFSVYFLYGEESFLTQTYAKRIKNKALGDGQVDINLLELNGNPDMSMLSDHVETLPFFADHRVIMVNDFNPDKISDEEAEGFTQLIKKVPDTTILVFYLTGFNFSPRTQKAKKLFEDIKQHACVCEFDQLNKMQVGELIRKKAAKQKRLISPTNAEYLAEITGCDMNLASVESTKLCCYVAEGQEITREIIDTMVAKQLETNVYALVNTMTAGNKSQAFSLLDELFEQGADPVELLPALSSAYAEYYYAKAAKNADVIPQQVAADFGYSKGKASFAAKKYNEAAKMDMDMLRRNMQIIFEADAKCKSANIDKRVLMEETVLKLM
ncbi:MAG: DNA polymerase III subunit delta [Oscillospiraceae bacterium]|nr:DNA polymerase III subunit delta [Oscillospiraceae bacterium]